MEGQVKERPILFSGPMVRAIISGRKTQTRRIIKNPVVVGGEMTGWRDRFGGLNARFRCPLGYVGDRLWLREAHAFTTGIDVVPLHSVIYRADDGAEEWAQDRLSRQSACGSPWRPSIHMPRWASRITLEIEQVRVQRVQEISEEDGIAEGLLAQVGDGTGRGPGYKWHGVGYHGAGFDRYREPTFHVPSEDGRCRCRVGGPTPAQCAFRELWDYIHGPGAFDRNDWLWALTFRRPR